jgi:glucose-1-phosphate thymidylyltransferase
MKGIILAGGSGTRLRPLTKVTSKQLLPIYNKPMIYFPIETLLNAGIKDILIIVAPDHAGDFLKLLGSGKEMGCKFTYEIQDKPEGLAQAFLIGENFIGKDNVTLILGDNLFEDDFSQAITSFNSGGRVFAKEVQDPERFGVVAFDDTMRATSIEEKPKQPKSSYAVTGLYIYDNSVVEKARNLRPSSRGELEITDLNNLYLQEGTLDVAFVNGRWFDTGTFESLHEAITFVRDRELANDSEVSA